MSSPITTHILDTAAGRPAAGVPVTLERQAGDDWHQVARGTTNDDGRVRDWWAGPLEPGTFRITFDTGAYAANGFYPYVSIVFTVEAGAEHYHVPLLLSPYGYTTYRGS
jgi:5-hydroxyisourate hydrolase